MKDTCDIFSILRTLAILIIFVAHGRFEIGNLAPQVTFPAFFHIPAYPGIWILLGLSGYLIGKKFYDGKVETLTQVKNFYIGRLIRVGVPYYFLLWLVFLFISPVEMFQMGGRDWLRLLCFAYDGTPNATLGHTWFVSTIMQLYLVAPLVYHGLLKRIPAQSTWVCMAALLAVGFTARLILSFHPVNWFVWVYTFSPAQWDIFFVPFMLHAYRGSLGALPVGVVKYLRWAAVLLLAAAVGLGWFCWYHLVYVVSFLYQAPTLFTLILVVFGIAWGNALRTGPAPVRLQWGYLVQNPLHLLEAFAALTYSFYLYHQYILRDIPRILASYTLSNTAYLWLSIGGGFVLCTLWSWGVYKMLECPLNQWRHQTYPTGK